MLGAINVDPLDDLFACCPELIFTAGPDSSIRRMSASLARFFGPDVQPGTRVADRVHPDDRPAYEAGWARVEEAEPTREAAPPFTFRLLGADGAYQLVACRARRSAASGEYHASLREAAPDPKTAKLEHYAELLRVIEANIPISVWEINRQGIFVHHSGKGIEAAGLKQGQFLGMNLFEIYAGDVSLKEVHDAFAGQIAHTITKHYDTFWENWYVPLRSGDGEVTGIAGLTLDISAVTRAERALQEKIELIERQQQLIRALSTPIIEVWDKVLTLPMLGAMDSARASEVMDSLLRRISEKRSRFGILDLTGVDTIDSETAAHLLKMVQALRLLGAEGILVGISPSVARTMVTLGVDLESIVTRANLQDGLHYSIQRMREDA